MGCRCELEAQFGEFLRVLVGVVDGIDECPFKGDTSPFFVKVIPSRLHQHLKRVTRVDWYQLIPQIVARCVK